MATPPSQQQYYFIFTADSILRIPRLPTEVLLLILTYVPSEDLRHVALASRECTDSDRLRYLRQIVFHALQHNRSPRIALYLKYRPRGEDRTTGDMSLDDAVGAIAYALPYLAVLCVDVTSGFGIRLCAALTAPARFLHTFSVRSVIRDREGLSDTTLRLGPGLFSRDAPRLQSVTLDVPLLELPAAPIPVFHAVTAARVSLSFSESRIAVERLFPAVEDLTLCTRASCAFRHPITVDISALALRRLALDDPVGRDVKLNMNPALHPGIIKVDRECACPEEIYSTLWPLGAEVVLNAAHIFRVNHSRMAIGLRTADGARRVTLRIALEYSTRTALDELGALPLERPESLTVSESLLGELIQTHANLPALRTLTVDCTPGPSNDALMPRPPGRICVLGVPVAVCRLLCPALKTVIFSAQHRFPVRHAKEVTALGRLLATRPRLVLTGVSVTNLPCAMQYFSSVHFPRD